MPPSSATRTRDRAPPLFWVATVLVWVAVLGLAGAIGRHWLISGTADTGLTAEADRLRVEIAARQQALAAQGCAVAALGGTAPPVAAPAAAPDAVRPSPAASGDAAMDRLPSSEVIARLERGTVLVLTSASSGSGFFIAPDLVVTNRHVIDADQDGPVFVTSKALGRVLPGKLVALSTPPKPGAADFAVIRVPGDAGGQALPVSRSVSKLLDVVVAGYPGLAIGSDIGFRRLLAGDPSAAPDLNVTDGKVSAIQDSAFGLRQILHSASVLTGNSGGPLVDMCGRVIGINTFIAVDQEQSGRVSFALSAGDLMTFLQSASVGAALDDRACD